MSVPLHHPLKQSTKRLQEKSQSFPSQCICLSACGLQHENHQPVAMIRCLRSELSYFATDYDLWWKISGPLATPFPWSTLAEKQQHILNYFAGIIVTITFWFIKAPITVANFLKLLLQYTVYWQNFSSFVIFFWRFCFYFFYVTLSNHFKWVMHCCWMNLFPGSNLHADSICLNYRSL